MADVHTKQNIKSGLTTGVLLFALLVTGCGENHSTTGVTNTSIANQPPPSSQETVTHIVFSWRWLANNDIDPSPDLVKITFPFSWLVSAPPVPLDDAPIELSIPTIAFGKANESHDPAMITITLPSTYFKGLTTHTTMATPIEWLGFVASPSSLNFFTKPNLNPAPREIKLETNGAAADWALSVDAPWLKATPISGKIEASQVGAIGTHTSDTLTLSIDATGLPIGSYSATITIKSLDVKWPQEIPVRLFITNASIGQALSPKIEPSIGTMLTDSIVLGPIQVEVGTAGAIAPLSHYNQGDQCIVLHGSLSNTSEADYYVSYAAYGYAGGQKVSSMLEWGTAQTVIYLPSKTAKSFTLHLSWVEVIDTIKVMASTYTIAPP